MIEPGSSSDSKAADETVPASQALQTSLPQSINCSPSHQILTLVGSSFLCFEFIFLYLYFDSFWFTIDLSLLGIPAVLLSVIVAHLLLKIAESGKMAAFFAFVRKGYPLVFYKKLLHMTEEGIGCGVKHLRWEAIDEAELSWFGNLIIRSRLLCGKESARPDLVFKIPFSACTFDAQENFLQVLKAERPDVKLNKRLSTGRNPLSQKGSQATQLATGAIMSLLLLDVGFSSFYYLEILKNYFLAETDLLQSKAESAKTHFERAEELRLHPLPISWVSAKFLKSSTVAAGTWEQRSRVLNLQGKSKEAIEDSYKSVAEAPSNLRHRLYLTRLLVADNQTEKTKEQLEQILKDHKHSLMPRLYKLAIQSQADDPKKLKLLYKDELDFCYEDTFENEPQWPPGGNRHFIELFYSDDIRFLLDRFLKSKYDPPPYGTERK